MRLRLYAPGGCNARHPASYVDVQRPASAAPNSKRSAAVGRPLDADVGRQFLHLSNVGIPPGADNSILAEVKSYDSLRDAVRQGALFRQASFAEQVDMALQISLVAIRFRDSYLLERKLWVLPQRLGYVVSRLLVPA